MIIYQPLPEDRGHECDPPRAPDGMTVSCFVPTDGLGGQLPRPADYWPAGTVWECWCSTTWRADGRCWKREGWLQRRRRARAAREDQGLHLPPGIPG